MHEYYESHHLLRTFYGRMKIEYFIPLARSIPLVLVVAVVVITIMIYISLA